MLKTVHHHKRKRELFCALMYEDTCQKKKRKQIYGTYHSGMDDQHKEKEETISDLSILIGMRNKYCAREYVIFSHNRKEVIASFALI